MLKKFTLIAIAASSMAAALPMEQADARTRVFVSHGRHFHARPHFFRARYIAPVYAYTYYDGYGDGCYWMKRRALHTGSPYWWHRYRACRGY
jgi:hypothetical protein